jgi:hypothetical protein
MPLLALVLALAGLYPTLVLATGSELACGGQLLVAPTEEKAHQTYLRGAKLYNSTFLTDAIIDEMLSQGLTRPEQIVFSVRVAGQVQDTQSLEILARNVALRLLLNFRDSYALSEPDLIIRAATKLQVEIAEFLAFLVQWREEAKSDPQAKDLAQMLFYLFKEQGPLLAERVKNQLSRPRFPRLALRFYRRSRSFRERDKLFHALLGPGADLGQIKIATQMGLSRIEALLGWQKEGDETPQDYAPYTLVGRRANYSELPFFQKLGEVDRYVPTKVLRSRLWRMVEEAPQLSLTEFVGLMSFFNKHAASTENGRRDARGTFKLRLQQVRLDDWSYLPDDIHFLVDALLKVDISPERASGEGLLLAHEVKKAFSDYLARTDTFWASFCMMGRQLDHLTQTQIHETLQLLVDDVVQASKARRHKEPSATGGDNEEMY